MIFSTKINLNDLKGVNKYIEVPIDHLKRKNIKILFISYNLLNLNDTVNRLFQKNFSFENDCLLYKYEIENINKKLNLKNTEVNDLKLKLDDHDNKDEKLMIENSTLK